MPLDELEQKIVNLQNQIDNLTALINKNNFSNIVLLKKDLIAGNYNESSDGFKLGSDGKVEMNEDVSIGDVTGGKGIQYDKSTDQVKLAGSEVSQVVDRANILYDDYVFIGNYNDGLTEVAGGGGSITRQLLRTTITSDGNDCYLSSIGTAIDASNNLEVNFSTQLTQIITQDVFMGATGNPAMNVPPNSTYAENHFGFMVEDGTLYASVGNGAQTKSAAISGITLGNINTYKIVHTAGVNVKFYINGTLVATLSTNIPGAGMNPSLYFGIISQAGPANRNLRILNNYIIKSS